MANKQLKFLVMFVFIVVLQTTTGEPVVNTPLNRVAYEGSTNTRMICEGNDPYLDWLLSPFAFAGSSGDSKLTTNGEIDYPLNELFAIDHSQGAEVNTLVIFNATISPSDRVTFSTAGMYQCYYYYTGLVVEAQLVVIRNDPICLSNFTQSTAMLQWGDIIQLSCTIVYGAYRTQYRIDAVMSWSVNGQPIPANNVTFTITTSPQEITATSTIFVNKNYDGTYVCATTFGEPTDYPPPEVAYNAPDYFKTCTIRHYRCLSDLKNTVVHEGQLNTVMHQGRRPQIVEWSVLPSSDEMILQTITDSDGNKNPLLTELYDANYGELFIKNATTIGNPISTAGLYVGQCDNDNDRTGAKLLVIRTGPECSSTPIDSTSSSVSCSVTFADSVLLPMYPIITWKRNGVFLASDAPQVERIDLYVSFATSTITSDSGVPENYECELTFAAPIDIRYPWVQTNAPEFKESCSITG